MSVVAVSSVTVAMVATVREHGGMVIVGIAVLGAVLLSLPVLTGLGEHRRGARAPVVLLGGLFFPITWLVWYLKDEKPLRRPSSRVA